MNINSLWWSKYEKETGKILEEHVDDNLKVEYTKGIM